MRPSAFSPFLRRWPLFGLAALLLLIALAALLTGPGTAQAQTPASSTLVKNTGQTDSINIAFNEDLALPFTTGPNADGYKLTSVELTAAFEVPAGSTSTSFTVSIHPGSGTSVGSSVGSLTSSALTAGTNSFTSSSGIDLDANTSYFVVLDISTNGNKSPHFTATASDAEDSGGAPGWSIGDRITRRHRLLTTWSLAGTSNVVEMNIKGYAKVSKTPLVDKGRGHADGPNAPTGYVAPGPGDGQITVHWTPAASGQAASIWTVAHQEPGDLGWGSHSLFLADKRSHTISGLEPGLRFNVIVRGWYADKSGDIAQSDNVVVPGTTLPTFSSAAVNGTTLNLSFSAHLDPGSAPAGSAFSVSATPTSGSARSITGTGTATIDGRSATVTLASAVKQVETVTVSYTKPSQKPLQGAAGGNDVVNFSGQPATNNTDDTPPSFYAAQLYHWQNVWIVFDEPMDENSLPDPSAFTVTQKPWVGGPPPHVPASDIPVTGVSVLRTWGLEGRSILLSLGVESPSWRTMTVSYAKPSVNPLRDRSGNEMESFRDQPVGRGWPLLMGAAVSSDAGADRTYGFGEKVRVQITFATPVNVTTSGGRPRLKIDLDPESGGERWAVYESGSGTDTLTFAYTVAGSDASTAGIRVPANPIDLNGGRITSRWQWPPYEADVGCTHNHLCQVSPGGGLAHLELAHNPAHQVDGGLPLFQGAEVDGETLTLTFTTDLDPASTPAPGAFNVSVNGARRNVADGGVAIAAKTVTLTLASAVRPHDTVKVGYTRPSANPLQGVSGSAVGNFADQEVTFSNHFTIWSATLTAKVGFSAGCDWQFSGWECSSRLSDNSFSYGGTTYRVERVAVGRVRAGRGIVELGLSLDKAIPRDWVLHAGDRQFPLADTVDMGFRNGRGHAYWPNPGLTWTETQPVSLRLTAPVLPAPVFQSAEVDGTALTLTFDANLDEDTTPAPGAFHVTVNGARRNVASGGVAISGNTVTLTLASAVSPTDTVKVRYTRPSANPLHRPSGRAVETFPDQEVTKNIWSATLTVHTLTTPRGLTYVGCFLQEPCSGALTDDTFTMRDTSYQVLAVQTGPVFGTHTLNFDVDNALSRDWTLHIDGRKFPIASATLKRSGTVAQWSNPDITWTANQKVSLRLTVPALPAPEFQSAAVDETSLTVTFDADLDAASKPSPGAFYVTVNDARRSVASGGVAISGQTVTLTLVSAVSGGDTVKVRYTRPSARPLARPFSRAVETFADQSVTNNTAADNTLVSNTGQTELGSAVVVGNSGGKNYWQAFRFTAGDNASGYTLSAIDLKFERLVDNPTFEVSVHNTDSSGNPASTKLYTLTNPASVAANELLTFTAPDGATLDANTTYAVVVRVTSGGNSKLTVQLSASQDEDSGAASGWSLANSRLESEDAGSTWRTFNTNPVMAVKGTTTAGGAQGSSDEEPNTPASVSGVSVASSAGPDNTYGIGDTIGVTLTFSETVDVTGAPRLKIDMDPAEWGEKWASYASGSGTATLTFTHTVVEPNISTQGIAVLANTLELNGGTIRSGDVDAALAHTGQAHNASHKVDWQVQSDGGGAIGTSDEEPATSESNRAPPSVSDVNVTSSPQANATYGLGETIQVTLTFSENVDVTGTPRLQIDMDPSEDWGEKWAAYDSGSGTATLTFSHTVVEPNISTQGIAVLENTLQLNGGTIRSGDVDANLAHTGLAHNAIHKVDWRPPAPDVDDVEVTSDAGSDDTYGLNDVITISVTFDEAVDVDTTGGAPRLKIDMDPAEWGEKWAVYASGSGTTKLTFTHTVVEPNISTQGIAVLANTLQLNGGDIESTATDTDARLSHKGLAHDADHKVDWQAQSDGGEGGPVGTSDPPDGGAQGSSDEEPSDPATVSGVNVTSSPQADATYGLGETIQVTLTFSENVDVTGTPRLKIDMDPADWGEKWASYHSGTGTATLTFTHTVVEPNISTQGIAVLENSLQLNGGTIQSSGVAANLDHDPLAHNASHKVDWRLPLAKVTDVSVTSDPGADDTYGLNDVITITLTFSKTVDVDTTGGAPRLKIDMDPAEWGEKWASYASGSGTATLTFTHTVVEPNISTQGIAVLANTLDLNGGTIRSDGLAALLAHTGRAHDAGHKVDWQLSQDGGGGGPVGTSDPPDGGAQGSSDEEPSTPASVSGVNVTSSPQADATYGLGETIQVTLTFSENVDVTGTPRLKIDMDPAEWGEKWAAYQSGTGTATLVFTHTVVEPNISTQGIAVLENSLQLNGGTIQSSGVAANLDHDALAHNANHKVDWRLPLAKVTGVSITSDPGGDDTYGLNDVISITLTFSKTVDVDTTGGAPRLKIDMDPAVWGEKWASYASGSGTATLTFTHTVVEPNISTQGIAVLENSLQLNGGTIQSDGLAALLAHTGRAHDAGHKVDWQQSEENPGS